MTRECDRANMSESKNMPCCSLAPNAGTRLLMPKPHKLCYTSNTAKIGLRTHKGYFSVNFRVLGVILHSCVIFPVLDLAGSINVFITAVFTALPIFSCCCRTMLTKTFYKPPMYSTQCSKCLLKTGTLKPVFQSQSTVAAHRKNA